MRRAALPLILLALPGAAFAADTCRAEYQRGFTEGVAAVNAQLGAVTAKMQQDVQAQVDAQLAALEKTRTAQLEERLAAAQGSALEAQGPVTIQGEAGRIEMPALPPLTRAPGGGIVPALPREAAAATVLTNRPDARIPADPAALPAGTTITITDPQNLPPELFRALMDFAGR